jgi:nitroreductase
MRFTGASLWELYTFGPPTETIGARVAGDAGDLPCTDVWTVMSTARAIRRFTAEPVDDATLARCLRAAAWAPSGANAQERRFIVLQSPEQRAVIALAAREALKIIEPVYGMTRPADDDDSPRARNNRATYELHDRAGELTSVLFTQKRFATASELLLGGSIFPAVQNFLLAARALGLGACLTSWASYGGEQLIRDAVGVPGDWMMAGHVVVGWPRGRHGPLRRRPLADVIFRDRWGADPGSLAQQAE